MCVAAKEEFDVLRLIEHNQACYVSSENVKGATLVRWLKYHPCMPKEQLFQWIQEIVKQLEQIHKCRGRPCYRYMNPYSIIVTEERELYFLDTQAESNAEQIRQMCRRTVREHFLPPDEAYYQKASEELDIYGLGRTIQYLMSETETEPHLSRGEEVKFQKLISRCLNRHSKRTFKQVSDIPKYIPRYRPIKTKGRCRAFLTLAGLTITGGLIFSYVFGNGRIPENKAADEKIDEESAGLDKTRTASEETTDELHMELGILYFLELRDYEKSEDCFRKIKGNGLAENMAVIAECMQNGSLQEDKLRKALKSAEAQLPKTGKESYYLCFLRGYTCLASEEDVQNVLRIGEICLSGVDKEALSEVQGSMADAYEKSGQPDKAVVMYEELMKEEVDPTVREAVYKKMADLLDTSGQPDKAQEKLREGIKEFPETSELRIQYIRMQCKDQGIDRSMCMQTIEENLKELPALREEEEFQKLMKEYGIKVKGEKVWEEK